MNRFIKSLMVVLALTGLFGSTAFAAPTSFVTPQYVGEGTALPGVRITIPVSASGDTVSAIINMSRVLGWNPGGTVSTYSQQPILWGFAPGAAGDSISVAVDAGIIPKNYSLAWQAIDSYATWLNTMGGNTTTTTQTVANQVKFSNGLTSTWFPAPYWRVRCLAKSALASVTYLEIRFPRETALSRPAGSSIQ